MSDFVAQIRAKLDTSKAEEQLKSLQNNHVISLDVKLTGSGADLVKSFNKQIESLNTTASKAGKSTVGSFNRGVKSVKVNGFYKDYFKQLRADQNKANKLSNKFNASNRDALTAVRAKRTAESKANNASLKEARQQQNQLNMIENARLKSIENARKRERSITLQQNKAINKSNEIAQKAQLKAIENAKAKQQKELALKQSQLSAYASKYDSNNYSSNSKVMHSKLTNFGNQDIKSLNRAKKHLYEYDNTYKDIQNHFNKSVPTHFNDDELIEKFKNLMVSEKKYNNAMREVATESSKVISQQTATIKSNEILDYYNKNTKAVKKYGDSLIELSEKAKKATTQKQYNDVNADFKLVQSKIKKEGLAGRSIGSEVKRAASQIAQFVGIYGILQKGVDSIHKMAAATLEVDTAMTNLQMATGVNVDKAKELMNTYQQMGKELKATGVDVATSATEWLKQGQSPESSQLLAKYSIILSKIGGLSSSDSTKYLTSAMKGYKIDTEHVLNIVDKLSAVDLASATDVGGLAAGMSEVANNANLAGVSMDKLLGYLAAVGEVTQEGMSTVGHSFSTIFSRMGNIKLSRLKDYQNNGDDLSNVETVLRGEGVKLRDSTDTFRNFGDVIDEVASKWGTYSEVSQRAIASAFAGKNQMEEFLVLMQNYDKATEYKNLSEDSSGQAIKKFEAYQNSLQGKIEGLKGAFQSLSTVTLNSGFLKGATNAGTTFLNVLTKIIDVGGGLPAILGTIGGLVSTKKGWGKHIVSCIVYDALPYKTA